MIEIPDPRELWQKFDNYVAEKKKQQDERFPKAKASYLHEIGILLINATEKGGTEISISDHFKTYLCSFPVDNEALKEAIMEYRKHPGYNVEITEFDGCSIYTIALKPRE